MSLVLYLFLLFRAILETFSWAIWYVSKRAFSSCNMLAYVCNNHSHCHYESTIWRVLYLGLGMDLYGYTPFMIKLV